MKLIRKLAKKTVKVRQNDIENIRQRIYYNFRTTFADKGIQRKRIVCRLKNTFLFVALTNCFLCLKLVLT